MLFGQYHGLQIRQGFVDYERGHEKISICKVSVQVISTECAYNLTWQNYAGVNHFLSNKTNISELNPRAHKSHARLILISEIYRSDNGYLEAYTWQVSDLR